MTTESNTSDCRICSNYPENPTCPCTSFGCKVHGICCECIAKHNGRGQVPGCLFSKEGEALHDRSLNAYLQDLKTRGLA